MHHCRVQMWEDALAEMQMQFTSFSVETESTFWCTIDSDGLALTSLTFVTFASIGITKSPIAE